MLVRMKRVRESGLGCGEGGCRTIWAQASSPTFPLPAPSVPRPASRPRRAQAPSLHLLYCLKIILVLKYAGCSTNHLNRCVSFLGLLHEELQTGWPKPSTFMLSVWKLRARITHPQCLTDEACVELNSLKIHLEVLTPRTSAWNRRRVRAESADEVSLEAGGPSSNMAGVLIKGDIWA